MAKINEALQIELLEQIKRLLILTLSEQGVKGKRIAEVVGVDPAIISRILSSKKSK
jgi:predicted transcriptional regulator